MTIPTVPPIPDVPEDVPEEVREFMAAVKEWIEVREGDRGKEGENFVTKNTLVSAGVVTKDQI